MRTLEIKIKRHTMNDSLVTGGEANTMGDMYIDDQFFCYTLEDQLRWKDEKVYGKTCIAAGRYRVVLSFSPRFQRVMPAILDVPMFEGIRIHGGNKAEHSHGCPLVAFNSDNVKIQGTAEKELTKRIKQFELANPEGKVWITIENKFLTHKPHLYEA